MESNAINITDAAETICAISTPPGVGGIAVARISGRDALSIVDKIWQGKSLTTCKSHTAHLGTVIDTLGQPLDQAVATIFRAPASFTGEDTVEISIHGSRYIQRELIGSLIKAGARLAQPGEFTRRAFVSGKFDLTRAEAVADMIASNSRAAHRQAMNQMSGGVSRLLASLRDQLVDLTALLELELDFSEEDVEFADRSKLITIAEQIKKEIIRLEKSFASGRAIKDGIPVAIVGATNAGKSSLLNALLGDDRAIVSDIHGTTRDTIEETIELGNYTFRFIDTAGLRDTDNPIEATGIERSIKAIDKARIVLCIIDSTQPIDQSVINRALALDSSDNRHTTILVLNKCDLSTMQSTVAEVESVAKSHNLAVCRISAKTGENIEQLSNLLIAIADNENDNAIEDILITNARHAQALHQASNAITDVIEGLQSHNAPYSKPIDVENNGALSVSLSYGKPIDLIAEDLRRALSHLAEITGEIPSTEILATIFSRFCIGK